MTVHRMNPIDPVDDARLEEEAEAFAMWLELRGPEMRASLDTLTPDDFEKPNHREALAIWQGYSEPGTMPGLIPLGALLEQHGTKGHLTQKELVDVSFLATRFTQVSPEIVAERVDTLHKRRTYRKQEGILAQLREAKARAARSPEGLGHEHEAEVADLFRQLSETEVESVWDEPTPLPGTPSSKEFPIDTLGSVGRDYSQAVAHETGTAPDLAAVTVMGVISAAIAGAVTVSPQDRWNEPVNIYTVALLQPGEGKSPVLSKVIRPLEEVERERTEQKLPDIRAIELKRDLLEERLAGAKKQAVKARDKDTQLEHEHEAYELQEELAMIHVPAPPRVYTSESTPEGLNRLLAEQRGRMAVITDEGGEFFQLASRYQGNGSANLGIYLKGADGDRYVVDRAGREALIIERVTLTVSLMAQRVILDELRADKQMAGRGLFARFLWTQPRSIVGFRSSDRSPVPEHLSDAYAERIRNLAREADAISEPITLKLDAEATRVFQDFRKQHEPKLRPEIGELSGIPEWANKLPGSTLRLAGVLHALRSGTIRGTIDAETMEAAVRQADYFTSHALAVFGQMRSDGATADALDVHSWITSRPQAEVTVREITRSKSWDNDRTKAALEALDRYGWVKKATPSGKRGRPAERFLVHPIIQNQDQEID